MLTTTKDETAQFLTKDGMNAIIRPVTTQDAPQLTEKVKEIIKQGLIQKEKPRTVNEEIEYVQMMTSNNNMYICVEINNEVMGIARLVRGELEMKKHVALFRTWLTPNAQGKGIGKAIMEYTKTWAKKNGVEKICLTVFSRNEIAYNLYKKYGFVHEGTQKRQVFFNGEYDDEIHMAYFTNIQ
jgi:RimJ/RimL family protein N-acetyltransferase